MVHVTAIVPVFNAGVYLEPCLKSIKNQTDKMIQIIVIDDGSTDGSGLVCDSFATEDDRFTVLHQDNLGKAAALDVGLKLAKGDFLSIVDSDDWLELDYYEKLYSKAKSENLDIIISDYYTEPGGKLVEANYRPNTVLSGDSLVRSNIHVHTSFDASFSCRMLFAAQFVRECGLRFRHDLIIGEDTEFNLRALYKANRTMYLPYAGYHYVLHEGSLVRRQYKESLERDLKIQYDTRSRLFTNIISYRKDMARYYVESMFYVMLSNMKNDPKGFEIEDFKRLLNMKWLVDSYREIGWRFNSHSWKEWLLHILKKLRITILYLYYK